VRAKNKGGADSRITLRREERAVPGEKKPGPESFIIGKSLSQSAGYMPREKFGFPYERETHLEGARHEFEKKAAPE